MIAVLKNGTNDAQIKSLTDWIESLGLQVHLSRGEYQTIVGLVGDTSRVDEDLSTAAAIATAAGALSRMAFSRTMR